MSAFSHRYPMLASLAASVFALAACGGGGSDNSPSPAPSPAPAPAVGNAPAPAPSAGGSTASMAQAAASCRVTARPEASGPDGTDYQCVVGDYLGEIPGETGSRCSLNISAQGDISYSDGTHSISLPHNTWSGSTLDNETQRQPPLFIWSAVTPSGFLMIVRNPEGIYGVTAAPYISPGVIDTPNALKPCYLR